HTRTPHSPPAQHPRGNPTTPRGRDMSRPDAQRTGIATARDDDHQRDGSRDEKRYFDGSKFPSPPQQQLSASSQGLRYRREERPIAGTRRQTDRQAVIKPVRRKDLCQVRLEFQFHSPVQPRLQIAGPDQPREKWVGIPAALPV